MPAGKKLIEVHSPYLGLDGTGNLLLDTAGKLAEQIAAGNIPQFGGKGIPTGVTITNAAGGTQYYCDVTFQIVDLAANAVAGLFEIDVWLSDAATGAGLTATTASGGITAETSDGTILGVMTAAKALTVQTNASGIFVLRIVDSAKTAFYPCACLSVQSVVGAQLTTASYHP
jgi:hypothetical protein